MIAHASVQEAVVSEGRPVSPSTCMLSNSVPGGTRDVAAARKTHVKDLMIGEEENEDEAEGEGAESRQPRRAPTPPVPPQQEREDLVLSGNVAYRSWCRHCVQSRGRNLGHQRRARFGEPAVPVLSWDYCYLGSKALGSETVVDEQVAEAEGQNHVLVLFDGRSKGVYGVMHQKKGAQFEGVEAVLVKWVSILNGMGYRRVIFRSDNEPSLIAFLGRLKEAWIGGEVVPERSDVGEPQSNGAAESAVGILKGMVRTLKMALEGRLGSAVPADHALVPWLVHMASSMQRRFKVGPDGRTPYERIGGRRANTPMVEIGERVWFMPLRASADRQPALGERYVDGD